MYFFFRHDAYLLDYSSVNITVYTGRPKHSFDSLDCIICSTVVVQSTTCSISKACLNESAEESMGMSGGYWHYSCFFLILQNTFGLWQWCAQHDESNHNISWCPPPRKEKPCSRPPCHSLQTALHYPFSLSAHDYTPCWCPKQSPPDSLLKKDIVLNVFHIEVVCLLECTYDVV